MWISENQLHVLITFFWDALKRECKPNETVIDEYRDMFESRISAGPTEKITGWDKPHAKMVAWSHDMEGHAQECVEGFCELANEKTAILKGGT